MSYRKKTLSALLLLCFIGMSACSSQKATTKPHRDYILSKDAAPCAGQGQCQEVCSADSRGLACLEVAMYTLSSSMQEGRSIILNIVELLGQEPIRIAFETAARQLDSECENREPVSCFALGNLHLEGLGVLQDQARAIGLIQSACDQGVADACTRIGQLYEEGIAVARDPSRAKAYFEMSCTGGDPLGCQALDGINP